MAGSAAIVHRCRRNAALAGRAGAAGWARAAAAAASAAFGCGEPLDEGWPRGRACTAPATPATGSEGPAHFSPLAMPCVQLGMSAADAAALRADARFEGPPFGAALAWAGQCTTEQPGKYRWFEAELRFDGLTLPRIGVRKKGFVGSLSRQKPSLKLDLDRHVEGQALGDIRSLTLNNGRQDQSRFSPCLAYGVFAAAGVPAPRCNLANVMLGAEALGPYAHVEPMDEHFLARAFGDAGGAFYEGTVADFAPSYLPPPGEGTGHFDAQSDATDPDGGPLRALAAALAAPDGDQLEAIALHVDVERYAAFWAVEVVIGHRDSYSAGRNNFHVYFDPGAGGRAVLLPWGADAVFDDDTAADDADALRPYLEAELPRRLSRSPAGRALLLAALRQVLAQAFDEAGLLAAIDGFAAQVRSAQADPEYSAELSRLRGWVHGRRARVQAWIDRGVPAGAAAPTPCGEVLGPFWVGALFKDIAFGL